MVERSSPVLAKSGAALSIERKRTSRIVQATVGVSIHRWINQDPFAIRLYRVLLPPGVGVEQARSKQEGTARSRRCCKPSGSKRRSFVVASIAELEESLWTPPVHEWSQSRRNSAKGDQILVGKVGKGHLQVERKVLRLFY